jgi:predicted dehydrogenase
MKSIVVGLGVQGYKRREHAGNDHVASVDPVNKEADYRDVKDVPLSSYDAALCCIPDEPKFETIRYLLENSKHVLVEKPLWADTEKDLAELQKLARSHGVFCYTAYNHRFEPHFVRMRDLIDSGELGNIYSCRMFYGNGTARLVRESQWRDKGAGVLPDLGSHLLDTVRFWFGNEEPKISVYASHCFENASPDHVVIGAEGAYPRIELEMTLLMWRNHFTCDVLAENGTAHITSLCKWGPSSFVVRRRVLPSGRPPEESITLIQDDPTWALEYEFFSDSCIGGRQTDLQTDIWLNRKIRELSAEALERAIS